MPNALSVSSSEPRRCANKKRNCCAVNVGEELIVLTSAKKSTGGREEKGPKDTKTGVI